MWQIQVEEDQVGRVRMEIVSPSRPLGLEDLDTLGFKSLLQQSPLKGGVFHQQFPRGGRSPGPCIFSMDDRILPRIFGSAGSSSSSYFFKA